MRAFCLLMAAVGCTLMGTAASAGQCTTLIDNLQKKLSAADAGRGSTKGASGLPGQEVAGNQGAENTGTPVTSGNALQGKGASPGDVPQQNRGQQTGAEAAQSGGRVPPNAQSAEERLAQARKLDKAGHETECQAEVTKAKAAFGVE